MHDEFLQALLQLGLNRTESLVYLALLEEDTASASRIAHRSGVPQPNVYTAMRVLTQRGFVQQILGETKLFRAVPPTTAFAAHRAETQRALDATAAELARLESQLPRRAVNEDPVAWGVRLLQTEQSQMNAYHEVVTKAESEIVISMKPPGMVARPGTAKPHPEVPKGVAVYRLVDRRVFDDLTAGTAAMDRARRDPTVRIVEPAPLKCLIVDRKIALVTLLDKEDEAVGLLVPSAALASDLAELCLRIWQATPPFREQETGQPADQQA